MVILVAHPDHFAWLGNFQKFLELSGHKVIALPHTRTSREQYQKLVSLPECTHVFMWNGTLPPHAILKKMCAQYHKTYSILEVGFFPQKEFYIIDRHGINASSTIMTDKLEVTPEDRSEYERFRLEYLAGREWKQTNQYILAPMQMNLDSNIRLHSPVKNMQEFIAHVESKFPDKKILFKRHPKDTKKYLVNSRNGYITSGHILDVAQDAELVYGINSTSLLETSMMGVPTVSIGNGFLRAHADRVQDLLIYLCKRQIPVSATDLTKWLKITFPNFPKEFT